MITADKDFSARVDGEKARELLGKHTDPISYILPQLVKYSDKDISSEEPIIAKELNELLMYVATKEGLSIGHIDAKGKIDAKYLASEIRATFELDDEWTTITKHITELKKSEQIYPKFYKTTEYNVWLEEMNGEKEKDEK